MCTFFIFGQKLLRHRAKELCFYITNLFIFNQNIIETLTESSKTKYLKKFFLEIV